MTTLNFIGVAMIASVILFFVGVVVYGFVASIINRDWDKLLLFTLIIFIFAGALLASL